MVLNLNCKEEIAINLFVIATKMISKFDVIFTISNFIYISLLWCRLQIFKVRQKMEETSKRSHAYIGNKKQARMRFSETLSVLESE